MLAKNPINAALYRPVLYGGVAPQFLLVEASAVFLLLFEAGLHVLTVGLCLFYCLGFHPLAVYLCGKVPLIADLYVRSYVRSLRGRDFYCATPALGARCLRVDPALPEGR